MTVDPSVARRRTEYENVRTGLLQAAAEVDVPGGFRGDGEETSSADYCSVFLDGFVSAKSAARSRENVTAALRADGWKQIHSGGTDESLLTRDTWSVFVTRTTTPLAGADGKMLHELTIKADCGGNS